MPTAVPARFSTSNVYGFEKYAISAYKPRRRTIRTEMRIGGVTLAVLIAGVMSALALMHLLHSNTSATKGYELRKVQSAHQELVNESKVLRMKVAELQALKNVNEGVGGMVAAYDVNRFKVDHRFALK